MTKLIDPTPWGSIEEGLPFGSTKHPYSKTNPHKGKDHKWRYSDPVRSRKVVAPVSGKIKTAHNDGLWHSGWGNYIDIQWGDDPNDFVRLAHLRTGTVRVRVGDRVKAGDLLGTMGNTGNTGGDDHLHEELWINGKRVDPDLYRGPKGKHLPGTEGPAGGGEKPLPPKPEPKPEPAPQPEEEEEEMRVHTVHARAKTTNGVHDGDWTLGDPEAGLDLKPFAIPVTKDMYRTVYEDGKGGVVREFHGFWVTNIPAKYIAWARTWAWGGSRPHSVTVRADYQEIQIELSRVAGKKTG